MSGFEMNITTAYFHQVTPLGAVIREPLSFATTIGLSMAMRA